MNLLTQEGIEAILREGLPDKKESYTHTSIVMPIRYQNQNLTGVLIDHRTRDISTILRVLFDKGYIFPFAETASHNSHGQYEQRSFLVSTLPIDKMIEVMEICARKLHGDNRDYMQLRVENEPAQFSPEIENRYGHIFDALVKIRENDRKRLPNYSK